MVTRRASSMLELVIAIVVMGIAMMTLPLMLATTQNNNTFAMQQEAILAARTKLGDVLTYRWDENSMDTNYNIEVLDTNSTNSNFERNSTIRRIGHVKGNKRRKYFTNHTYATSIAFLGSDANDTDDIDDFSATTPTTIHQLAESAGALDYRFDINMTTTVSYINDNFTEGNNFVFDTNSSIHSTNIKMIKIHLVGRDNLNITLRAYSSNIGSNQLSSRDF